MEQQQFSEAESFYKRSLQLSNGVEESHPNLFAETCVCLHSIRRRQGDDPRLGIEILEVAAKKIQTFARVGYIFGMLGVLKKAIGHHFEAELLLKRALDLSCQAFASDEDTPDEYLLNTLVAMLLTHARSSDALSAVEKYSLN